MPVKISTSRTDRHRTAVPVFGLNLKISSGWSVKLLSHTSAIFLDPHAKSGALFDMPAAAIVRRQNRTRWSTDLDLLRMNSSFSNSSIATRHPAATRPLKYGDGVAAVAIPVGST